MKLYRTAEPFYDFYIVSFTPWELQAVQTLVHKELFTLPGRICFDGDMGFIHLVLPETYYTLIFLFCGLWLTTQIKFRLNGAKMFSPTLALCTAAPYTRCPIINGLVLIHNAQLHSSPRGLGLYTLNYGLFIRLQIPVTVWSLIQPWFIHYSAHRISYCYEIIQQLVRRKYFLRWQWLLFDNFVCNLLDVILFKLSVT